MRALNIAIFIFMLSLATSTVKVAWGISAPGEEQPLWTMNDQDVVNAAKVTGSSGVLDMVTGTFSSIQVFLKVLAGAAMLGSTLQSFIPYPAPDILVNGLNILGVTSMAIAIAQLLRGVGTKTMD